MLLYFLCLALLAVRILLRRTETESDLPGPPANILTKWALFLQLKLMTVPEFVSYWRQKHGDFFKLFINGTETIIISHPDIARQVFMVGGVKNNPFTQRFGEDFGLKQIGMFEQGVIWNNSETWAKRHALFENAVMSVSYHLKKRVGSLKKNGIASV